MRRIAMAVAAAALVAASCGTDEPGSVGAGAEPLAAATTAEQPTGGPDVLVERTVSMRTEIAAGESIFHWYSQECRDSFGLITEGDPLAGVLGDDLLDFVDIETFPTRIGAVEVDGGDGVVEVLSRDGEFSSHELWTFEAGEWRYDHCDFYSEIGLTAHTLIGQGSGSAEGFAQRITDIQGAVGDRGTGVYQWLSARCRAAAAEELEDWLLMLASPDWAPEVFQFPQRDEIRIDSVVEGDVAFTSPVLSDWLASGNPVDRWVFERDNWYYDGCPNEDDTSRHLALVEAKHAGLIGLRIEGLVFAESRPRDINGPWQLDLLYDSTSSSETWWDAQATYMDARLPKALEKAGYRIVENRGQWLEGRLIADDDAFVAIGMDQSLNDYGPYRFTISLHYVKGSGG